MIHEGLIKLVQKIVKIKNAIYLQENVYLVKIINGVNFVIEHAPQIVKMTEEQIVVL